MIGVNPLRTKVLITTDEVIFHAPTDHEMDPRVILQSIIIAERRFIKPALCSTVYNDLVNAKNILVTSANIATLQTDVNDGRGDDREEIELVEGDYVNSDEYLDVDQLALWQTSLHKIVAECVWFISLPVNRARFTSKGVVKNNPESITSTADSVSVNLGDLKHLMDRGLQDRIYPLIEDMHKYMCDVSFPGYDRDCSCGTSSRKKGGIITSMYDDEDIDCRPCRRRDPDTIY